MKTASEIKNALENIKYYSNRIYELGRQQFNEDCNLGEINSQVGSIRFDALGTIGASCRWIDTYCTSIEKSLETAIKQDKVLQSAEKEK